MEFNSTTRRLAEIPNKWGVVYSKNKEKIAYLEVGKYKNIIIYDIEKEAIIATYKLNDDISAKSVQFFFCNNFDLLLCYYTPEGYVFSVLRQDELSLVNHHLVIFKYDTLRLLNEINEQLFYFICKEDGVSYLKVVDLKKMDVEELFSFEGRIENAIIISQEIIVMNLSKQNQHSDVYLYDNKKQKIISKYFHISSKSNERILHFDPKSKIMILTTDAFGYERIGISRYGGNENIEFLPQTENNWKSADQSFYFVNTDGQSLVYTETVGVKDVMVLYYINEKRFQLLKHPAGIVYNAFQNNKNEIVIIQNSPLNPFFKTVVNIDENIPDIEVRTDEQAICFNYNTPKIINFKTSGGIVESLVYNYENIENCRAIVFSLHGGPIGQWYYVFDSTSQLLAAENYVVVCPNYKGSTGYGREHILGLKSKWGEADLEQLMEIKQELCCSYSKEAMVVGHSYGGYLATLAVSKYPYEWKCAVSISGFYSMADLYEQGTYGVKKLLEEIAEFVPNTKYMNDPIAYCKHIVSNIMIIHGLIDTRIPIEQSRVMVSELYKVGNSNYEYHEIEDLSHDISGESNLTKVFELVLNFLNRNSEK